MNAINLEKEYSAKKNAEIAFFDIFSSFPSLKFVKNENTQVEIDYTLPIQEGLRHEVQLNLQNIDELHLVIGEFWCEWFSCCQEDVVAKYVDTVKKFISGEFRIVEFYNGNKCTKAVMQMFEDETWKIVASSIHLGAMLKFWEKKTQKIIINK